MRLILTYTVLALSASACVSLPPVEPPPGSSTAATSGAQFTTIGRTASLDPNDANHLRFGWPGVAFGIAFQGTSLDANIHDLTNTYDGQTVDSWYDVVVDGGNATGISITTQAQWVTLAGNLQNGNHTLWLTHRTEGMLGSTELFGFEAGNGGHLLTPPVKPTRHIEVVGASTETGYGVLNTNCTGYQPAQQDQGLAWPQLTANALGADLMNTSYSGKGLISNIDPSVDPCDLMPIMATLADPQLLTTTWDFNNMAADVVVFDIGANDWSGLGQAPDPNTFDAAFVSFVQTYITRYPNAEIYITLSSTEYATERTALAADYQSIVATLNQSGFAHVRYFEFPEYDGSVFGCDGHPTAALHQAMANEISTQIKTDLGWQ